MGVSAVEYQLLNSAGYKKADSHEAASLDLWVYSLKACRYLVTGKN